MKFSVTGQDKGDILMQVTTCAGLTNTEVNSFHILILPTSKSTWFEDNIKIK
jgi:hypothetical protein